MVFRRSQGAIYINKNEHSFLIDSQNVDIPPRSCAPDWGVYFKHQSLNSPRISKQKKANTSFECIRFNDTRSTTIYPKKQCKKEQKNNISIQEHKHGIKF